jgi:hypothetical protein
MIVAIVLIAAVELFGDVVHPFPEGVERTTEETCRHVEAYPPWVLALVVPAWAVAAFVGAWTAKRLGNLWSFAIVSLLLLAGLVLNISTLPYPMWFKIANLLVIPAAIVAAGRLSTRHESAGIGESK